MRRFSVLLPTTRRAEAISRNISRTRCPQPHHHEYGGVAALLQTRLINATTITPSLPFHRSCILAVHTSTSLFKLQQQQHHRVVSLHLFHTNARIQPPEQANAMEIEIISEENIKPSSPTPNHLRTFKLSILDQFFFPSYTPCILYFHNPTSLNDVINNQSHYLKTSLSHLLTRFYPFAGKITDNFEIDCNDQGVHFTEARVKVNLLDFLSQPDDHLIQRLVPRTLGNYVVTVQVNIFDCGGIALSTSVSHKLIDGSSYFTFLKAWASTMRGSKETINPSFVASTLFPQSHDLKNALPTKLVSDKNTITRRFVISSSALTSLKAKVLDPQGQPTRVEAASSLIWKCAAMAASRVRSFDQNSPHVLFSFVDIRRRDSPKLPDESIGNLIIAAIGVCRPKTQPELSTLIGEVKRSFASVNYDLFSKFKGEKGYIQVDGLLQMCNDLFEHIDEGDCLVLTSLCKSGVYEIDFGWGKPVWFCYVNPGVSRIVALADTVKGDGIEATVSLSPQEMAIFECDEELLSYASMDYNPLKQYI